MKLSFKEISTRAKKNHASAKGGSVHTGGSISVGEITVRMVCFLASNFFFDLLSIGDLYTLIFSFTYESLKTFIDHNFNVQDLKDQKLHKCRTT